MICCQNCNVDAVSPQRSEVNASIRFDATDAPNPALIGKNLRLVNGTLFTRDGAMPKGGFRVEMITTGAKHRISIYRMTLPFDELMLILQFDETVGEVQVRQFANVEPLVQLHLEMTKEFVEEKLYQELAPLVYRVPSRAAMLQLFEHRKLSGRVLEAAEVQIQTNNRTGNWPMMAIFHQNLLGVETRNSPVINIPDWRNNAAWQ
jgi:hypothetical protein